MPLYPPPATRQVIAQSAVPLFLTGTTTETAVVSIALPPLGPNDGLVVETVWSYPSSANAKQVRSRLNTAAGTGGTAFQAVSQTTSVRYSEIRSIWNRGATNSQISSLSPATNYGTSTVAAVTSAIETNAGSFLNLTGQLALGTETMVLEAYRVEVVRG